MNVTLKQLCPQHLVLTEHVPVLTCRCDFRESPGIEVGKYLELQVDLKYVFQNEKCEIQSKITISHFGSILLLGCNHKIGKGVTGWPSPVYPC